MFNFPQDLNGDQGQYLIYITVTSQYSLSRRS